MRRLRCRRPARLIALLAASLILLGACGSPKTENGAARVLLDGAAWDGSPVCAANDSDLRVYITLDGAPLIELPFDEPHRVTVVQDGVGENTVAVTGDAVYMDHADCENQDCVNMGAVTRENLELRVMGGFIVCLPHRVSVEVRGK